MQFQTSSVLLFVIGCLTISASSSPIPVSSAIDNLVVARLPEHVDSPLSSVDVDSRTVGLFGDSPLAPLDAEARENVPDNEVIETRPEEDERRSGCGRWACI